MFLCINLELTKRKRERSVCTAFDCQSCLCIYKYVLFFSPSASQLGSCSGITVLSLRSNKLTYIPDEIGRIPRLRVLNLSDNHLSYLPFTIVKLKELQALWLTENQVGSISGFIN